MKFPKSVHAEGWANHIDTTPSGAAPAKAVPAGGKKRSILHEPLHVPAPEPLMQTASPAAPFRATAASAPSVAPPPVRPTASATAPRSGSHLWLIGTGVGVALIGLAVMMSRTLSVDSSAPPTAIVSQAPTTSPEDALLQAQPPSTGSVTPAPAAQAAETTAATPPAAEPSAKAEKAEKAAAPRPAENAAPTLPVVRGDPTSAAARLPAPAPVREAALQPLAPVTPAVAMPTVPAPTPAPAMTAPAVPPVAAAPAMPPAPAPVTTPVPAVTPPVMAAAPATPPAVVPPETATPPVPPVVQAQPQPPVVNPEDAGITVKVRTALAADATLAAVPIAVSTEQGVVKLEGQAPDAPTRDRATVVAAATLGVKAVDNRLTLPPMATVGAVMQGSGG